MSTITDTLNEASDEHERCQMLRRPLIVAARARPGGGRAPSSAKLGIPWPARRSPADSHRSRHLECVGLNALAVPLLRLGWTLAPTTYPLPTTPYDKINKSHHYPKHQETPIQRDERLFFWLAC